MGWYEVLKDFAGPVATLCAATGALLITYRLGQNQTAIAEAQSKTAREALTTARHRVVMDLFDKRWAIVTDLRDPIASITRQGVVSQQDRFGFLRACDRAEFLFGAEVSEYLRQIDRAMSKHAAAQFRLDSENDTTRASAAEVQYEQFNIIADFHGEFNRLIAPYLTMTQKIPTDAQS